VDAFTDVLAFSSQVREPFVSPQRFPLYLGDVIISFPQAKTQAGQAGNTLLAELQLLVVHGILHLLGYDDQTDPELARMWAIQVDVLRRLGNEVRRSG
jgi:probable rRNA maturation factor